jgi:predicted RNase H-like nuclease (RuvC/YqgF family)
MPGAGRSSAKRFPCTTGWEKGYQMLHAIDLKVRHSHMDLGTLPVIVTALTGLFVAFGGGIKWMLARQDTHDERERAWQSEERHKLEEQFRGQIDNLIRRLENQTQEVQNLRTEMSQYQRHVGILEGMLRAHGVDVPPLEG